MRILNQNTILIRINTARPHRSMIWEAFLHFVGINLNIEPTNGIIDLTNLNTGVYLLSINLSTLTVSPSHIRKKYIPLGIDSGSCI